MEAGMEFGLENVIFRDFIQGFFWYFEIKCFSGDTQKSEFSSPKLQYIAYVAHPVSRFLKEIAPVQFLSAARLAALQQDVTKICKNLQKFAKICKSAYQNRYFVYIKKI